MIDGSGVIGGAIGPVVTADPISPGLGSGVPSRASPSSSSPSAALLCVCAVGGAVRGFNEPS